MHFELQPRCLDGITLEKGSVLTVRSRRTHDLSLATGSSLAADQTRSYRVHLVKAFDLSEILWSLRHKRIQKPPNNPLVQLSHAYPIQSTVVSNCEAVSQSANYVIVNLRSFFSSSASFQPAKSLPSEAVYASLVHKISGSFSLNAVFIQVFLVVLSPRLRISPCGCLS
jgi:hypothetical protein